MLGGFSPFAPVNSFDPSAVPSLPADVDTSDSDDSDSSDTTPAKQQSPFSTLNTPEQPQSPFSTLNGGYDGAIPNSPFSTLSDPSLINPLGPYGNPANLLRSPYGLLGNGYGTLFGLQPAFDAYGLGTGGDQLSVLDNPAFQNSLDPVYSNTGASRLQQLGVAALLLLTVLASAGQNQPT